LQRSLVGTIQIIGSEVKPLNNSVFYKFSPRVDLDYSVLWKSHFDSKLCHAADCSLTRKGFGHYGFVTHSILTAWAWKLKYSTVPLSVTTFVGHVSKLDLKEGIKIFSITLHMMQ